MCVCVCMCVCVLDEVEGRNGRVDEVGKKTMWQL